MSSYGATSVFLRLTIAILCMKACATVAVMINVNGAMQSNATEYPVAEEFSHPQADTAALDGITVRNAVIKASTVGLRLQNMPSRVKGVTQVRPIKPASLLHSGDSQTPSTTATPNSTTNAGSTTATGTASTTSQSTAAPLFAATTSSATPVGTVAPSGGTTNTTTSTAVAVTDVPWTDQQTPPPNAVPVLAAAITVAPSLMTGTLAPTPPPVPRWARGGLLTMHGCECSDSWQLNGLTLRGCVVSANVRMPWCVVKDPATCTRGYTNSALPISPTAGRTPGPPVVINGTWDFCTMPEDVDPHLTMSSCHCLPLWEHGGVAYSSCNMTNTSLTSKSWCYVAETEGNCEGARAPDATRLQRWDECDPPASEPSYLTKNSCHCKPRWAHLGKEYTSCIQDELVPAPANLNTTNTSVKQELLGWCQVFEDERVCPSVELTETGVLWDTCFFLDEATKVQLPPTLHGCHCLPEWSLDGVLYQGCAWTPLAKSSWCPVVEDQSACSNSLSPADTEYGAGRGRRRWDWCSVERPLDASQPWRLANERFAPKDPSPPSWYQNVYQELKDSHSDWVDDRRQEQASFLRRRRRF